MTRAVDMTSKVERKTHPVAQGTRDWLRLREGYFTASEAPAALGVSHYVRRTDLLRRKHTGVPEEHSQATLAKFRAGHEAEDRARPMAEQIAGGELYPTTMSIEIAGMKLLASLDGATLDGATIWETKLWNETLAPAVRAGLLPEHYKAQMDQELLVSGAERCLFTCTDGTPERFVSCWYEASQERFDELLSGWLQFEADLAAYVLPESVEPARAEPMESLPAVSVRLDGALTVVGNLPSFATALRAFVDRIPTKPTTDDEFATCEAACKALKRAEEALDAAEAGALASITDVDAMRRVVADCRKISRDTRLLTEKMVVRRKTEIKEQAVVAARTALQAHRDSLELEIAPMHLPLVAVDFAGAIKGLRSADSMQDALDTTLANAKIALDAQARNIRANVAQFAQQADGLGFLFADLSTLVHKASDDFQAVIQARIAVHRAAEAEKERKRAADEAARIAAAEQRARQQEAARIAIEAQRAAAAAQRAEDERLQEAARIAAEDARIAAHIARQQADEAARVAPQTVRQVAAEVIARAADMTQATEPAPADEPATLNLSIIGARLGFNLSAVFVGQNLGVHPVCAERSAKLYRESDFQAICAALAHHIERVRSASH